MRYRVVAIALDMVAMLIPCVQLAYMVANALPCNSNCVGHGIKHRTTYFTHVHGMQNKTTYTHTRHNWYQSLHHVRKKSLRRVRPHATAVAARRRGTPPGTATASTNRQARHTHGTDPHRVLTQAHRETPARADAITRTHTITTQTLPEHTMRF